MAIEIVDLPSYKMVMFHSYISLPEGINNVPILRGHLYIFILDFTLPCVIPVG